jgi:hypothetical protein
MVDGQPLHSHQRVVYGDEKTAIRWGSSEPFTRGGVDQNPGASRTAENFPLGLYATTRHECPAGTTGDHISEKEMSIGTFTCQGQKETTGFHLSRVGNNLTNWHILPQ